MKGYLHSIESLGTLDGPGLRSVVFLQGCPLKCKYCHNIDCAIKEKGKLVDHTEVVERVLKNKEYWEKNGGVTVSGGEPTFQPEFLYEILKSLNEKEVHTAIDSCLVTKKETIDKLLPVVNYWMVSIKHMDDEVHKDLTGSSNKLILENIKYLDSILKDKRLRIRFLVIPGITDNLTHVEMLGKFVEGLKNVDVMELLKYGEHGKYKWEEIYGHYPLDGRTREATNEDIEKVVEILSHYDIELKC
ncbi:radical SAM protein [Candidatus Dojkabacteria bacterium]|nr:radical SAM protein [Candidatus Dojkabacteria bacterium]